MREASEAGVVRVVSVARLLDGAAAAQLDGTAADGAHELVVDLTRVTEVTDDAVVLLAWLAQKLENAGGKLAVTTRRAREGRVTRTLWRGDVTNVLGVHPALDKTILHRLGTGTGGAVP